jgi:hypothetical protein
MNIDLNNNNGSTEFLNFSEALNHLRWGDCIARRSWPEGDCAMASYHSTPTGLVVVRRRGSMQANMEGEDIMAEDWFVLSENN